MERDQKKYIITGFLTRRIGKTDLHLLYRPFELNEEGELNDHGWDGLSVCLFNLLSIHKVESRTFLKHANTEAFLLKLRSLASII